MKDCIIMLQWSIIPDCVIFIMVAITSHIFINIFQMVDLFQKSPEEMKKKKNFLLTPKFQKLKKKN